MLDHKVIEQGYHVGKISELFENLEEIGKFSEDLINLSVDKSKYYTYRHNINEQGWPQLENKLEISQILERRKLVEENGLTVFQQWYETTHLTPEFNPIFEFFQKTAATMAFKIYDELNETNIHHIDSFTLFEKDDFIKEHTDGANPGRLCVVLIYLSDPAMYHDAGGKLIISENQVRTEVLPVRGNYVILDFTKHDIVHSVESVKNNFKRFCYIDFIYNRDKKQMNTNTKILITGGAGLVGQNLTNKLVTDGYTNIRVHLHTRQPRIKHDSVEYVTGNLMEYANCLEITKDVGVVIHAAASTSNAVDTVQDPLAHVTPNVAMNNFLIDSAYRNKVSKYIFISSNTVYPPKGDTPVVETDFLFDEPYPVYFPVGWMKRYAEVQCELYAKYLPNPMTTVVIRPANLFGPHDKYDFAKCHVTPATIRKVADNMNPIPVWGDGTELRDLLYIDDFIEALQLIIEKQETYDVFNVGCNSVYSVNDVLATMKSLVNNDNPIEYVKGKPSMIPTRRIDSNKINRVLGWSAKTPLAEGLKKAHDWYLENKDEFK